MAEYDFSSVGGRKKKEYDYSSLGGKPVDEDSEDESLLSKFGKHLLNSNPAVQGPELVKHGIAASLTGLQNTGNNLADAEQWMMEKMGLPGAERFKEQPGQRADFYKMMGEKEAPWYTPTGLAQTAMQYAAPGEIGAGASGLLNAGRLIPKNLSATKYLGTAFGKHWGNSLPNMLNRGIAGAITDMLGNENPTAKSSTTSGLLNALVPHVVDLLLKGGSKLYTEGGNLPNKIKNFILNQTEESAERGSAHTPQQAAENVEQNFTNAQGGRMPVDFGTATNFPAAKSAYDKAAMVPFSGASENRNIIKNQTADLAVSRAEQALADAEKYAEQVRGISAEDIKKQSQNIGETEAAYKKANAEHEESIAAHEGMSKIVDQAPNVVKNLIKEVPANTSLTKYLSNETRKVYKGLRADAKASYDELKNSDYKFNAGEIKFPAYEAARNELLEQRESLSNLFGPNSDMPSAITREIDHATSLLSHEGEISLKDIREHTSNLGKLWERAKLDGADKAAMGLMKMRKALVEDTKYGLGYTGQDKALNLWNDADAKWSQAAKFFDYKNMARVVGKKTTAGGHIAEADKLAKELHNPNNVEVMAMLPVNAQRVAGHLLITGDKLKGLSPEDIAKIMNGMTQDEFNAFNAHSPEEAAYLRDLSDNIGRRDALAKTNEKLVKTKKDLAGIIDRVKSPPGTELKSAVGNIGKRTEELKSAKAERLKSNQVKSGTGEAIGKVAGGITGLTAALFPSIGLPIAGVGGSAVGLSRQIQKLLTNPELLDKYIARERYPLKKAKEMPSLTEAIDKYITRNK